MKKYQITVTPYKRSFILTIFPLALEALNKHVHSKGEIPYEVELRYLHKKGHIVWVYSRGKIIEWDEAGKPQRMIGSHVDITRQKSVQLELERSNQELEQFAYIASHDLRAPLRGIDNPGYLGLKEDSVDALSEDSKKHLAQLKARVKRLDHLFDDLLEFSRIGRIRYEEEAIDLGDVARRVIDLIEPPTSFNMDVTGANVTAHVPRVPLEVILRNLVSNAIKHHDKDTGRIEISGHVSDAELTVQVKDDGPGIAPEFQNRIFDLFQTLKPRDTVEGSGMGLAFVKKLSENYNGAIQVFSKEGEGATFQITFPIANQADTERFESDTAKELVQD